MSMFNESKTGQAITRLSAVVCEARAIQAALSERLKPVLDERETTTGEPALGLEPAPQSPVELIASIDLIASEVMQISRENARILDCLAL